MSPRDKKIKIFIGIIVISVLGFAYYAISPLFINVKLDEKIPLTKTEAVEKKTEKENLPVNEPIQEIRRSSVEGTIGHPASGFVRIVKSENKTYVRYEEYKTINGPDIFVYLAKDKDAKEFVNLGKVKGTEGNINYEVPEGVNIREYPYVLTWCKAFGVLFNSADISAL